MAATYCTVDQVATQLGLVDTTDNTNVGPPQRITLSSSTNPTSDEVTEFIEDAQDYIDEYCQTSWRSNTVTRERHSLYNQIRQTRALTNYYSIQLFNKYCKSLDNGQGDELRVFNGTTMEEWLGVKTEGEAPGHEDYYFDAYNGRLFINTNFPDRQENNIEITYRYGKTTVPSDIRRATINIASAYIIQSGILNYTNITMVNETSMTVQQMAEKWMETVEKILEGKKTPLFFPQY